ncbi:GNAT family N-acetyltransferase [Magnetospirillum molischianum]|uniref:Putative GCN5-related N-acetyltransferase n=1 Tax=Magnetospirillum molischianum DSM 120 TaxID=1150626 RepID=H8FX06_MAGML|nr:GNAT family N-acetyltransferase [Magnetospirillum molischianum]CCG42894.1 putative GCN5-related N-acetyltransferase [Magnetospirillum molischianum DSM 120]
MDIRFGTADDIAFIADFIVAAGAGIFEQVFEGVLPGVKANDVLRMAVSDSNASLHFSNALLAEEQGRIAAMVLAYPSDEYGLPTMAKILIPKKRLQPLRPLFESRLPLSWYINTVAVDPAFRSRGLARLLLQTLGDTAEQCGIRSLTLHAWSGNLSACNLYRSLGFDVVGRVAIEPFDRQMHEGPMLLMQAPLPLLTASPQQAIG